MSSNTIESGSRFLRRFDDVAMRLRRVGLGRAVGVGLLILVAGVSLFVVLDYVFELSRSARVAGLIATGVLSLGVLIKMIVATVQRWGKHQTAATIERNFPELGQSVRTAVEFGRRDDAALQQQGVAPSLVAAMQQQTDRASLPLDFLSIVKTGMLIAICGALCFLTGSLITGSAVNSEWRTALQRTFLMNVAYTHSQSPSGSFRVLEGETATLMLAVTGRTNREVTLLTRESADQEWQTQTLTAEDLAESAPEASHYEVAIADVGKPFEYRFDVGHSSIGPWQVDVKYPLHIENVAVAVHSPAYTRIKQRTFLNEGAAAIEGSRASIQIQFDREPITALLHLKPMSNRSGIEPMDLPLEKIAAANIAIENETRANSAEPANESDAAADVSPAPQFVYAAEIDVNTSWRFVAEGIDEDGIVTESPEYSIRMRRDQPPRIWFSEPNEELEVHTLAEVNLQLKATDDFGLANAGIVFEINNENEYVLTSEDFAALMKALEEKDENPRPKTRATLERLLRLEFFELTQRDAVNYYAWAEDNRPDAPQRVETDLRFIDIRPFRRLYEVVDPDPNNMNMPGGERLLFLDDLIRMERALLNRTRRVAKRVESGGQADTSTMESLIEEQEKISDGVLRLVQFLQDRNIGGDELLFDAHEVMLQTIDTLAAAEFANAVTLEREAVKLLVEGRDALRVILFKNPPRARAMLRQFSRRESQKLRRPKSDEQELQELAEELRQLMQQQQQVASSLQNCLTCMNPGNSGSSGNNGTNGRNGKSGKQNNAVPKNKSNADTRQNDRKNAARDPQDQEDRSAADPSAVTPEDDTSEEKPAIFEKEDPQNGTNENDTQPSDREDSDSDAEPSDTDQSGGGNADTPGNGTDGDGSSGPEMSEEEIADQLYKNEELQNDIAVIARELEERMGRFDQITQLARDRAANAAQLAEEAAEQMAGGTNDKAQESAEKAGEDFGKLAEQVEALVRKEAAQRIAAAQSMASRMAQRQNQLANQLQNGMGQSQSQNPTNQRGKGSSNNRGQNGSGGGNADLTDDERAQLAANAKQLSEDAETLNDLLNAMARSTNPEEQKAAAGVQRIMEEQKLGDLTGQMQDVMRKIEDDDTQAASTISRDASARTEVAAQELEQLHRRIVAPRIQELIDLERRAARIVKMLRKVETQDDVQQVATQTRELVDDIDQAGLNVSGGDDLIDALRAANWNNLRTGDATEVSVKYTTAAVELLENLQIQIQELVLGDIGNEGNELVPAEYERLVERYYRVLSTDQNSMREN